MRERGGEKSYEIQHVGDFDPEEHLLPRKGTSVVLVPKRDEVLTYDPDMKGQVATSRLPFNPIKALREVGIDPRMILRFNVGEGYEIPDTLRRYPPPAYATDTDGRSLRYFLPPNAGGPEMREFYKFLNTIFPGHRFEDTGVQIVCKGTGNRVGMPTTDHFKTQLPPRTIQGVTGNDYHDVVIPLGLRRLWERYEPSRVLALAIPIQEITAPLDSRIFPICRRGKYRESVIPAEIGNREELHILLFVVPGGYCLEDLKLFFDKGATEQDVMDYLYETSKNFRYFDHFQNAARGLREEEKKRIFLERLVDKHFEDSLFESRILRANFNLSSQNMTAFGHQDLDRIVVRQEVLEDPDVDFAVYYFCAKLSLLEYFCLNTEISEIITKRARGIIFGVLSDQEIEVRHGIEVRSYKLDPGEITLDTASTIYFRILCGKDLDTKSRSKGLTALIKKSQMFQDPTDVGSREYYALGIILDSFLTKTSKIRQVNTSSLKCLRTIYEKGESFNDGYTLNLISCHIAKCLSRIEYSGIEERENLYQEVIGLFRDVLCIFVDFFEDRLPIGENRSFIETQDYAALFSGIEILKSMRDKIEIGTFSSLDAEMSGILLYNLAKKNIGIATHGTYVDVLLETIPQDALSRIVDRYLQEAKSEGSEILSKFIPRKIKRACKSCGLDNLAQKMEPYT